MAISRRSNAAAAKEPSGKSATWVRSFVLNGRNLARPKRFELLTPRLRVFNRPICTPKSPIAAPAKASSFSKSRFRVHVEQMAEAKVSGIHEHRVQHMRKRNTDKLARAKARPDPAQWGEDEVMTLVEAAAVFFHKVH
jgi:hypothetical protein